MKERFVSTAKKREPDQNRKYDNRKCNIFATIVDSVLYRRDRIGIPFSLFVQKDVRVDNGILDHVEQD